MDYRQLHAYSHELIRMKQHFGYRIYVIFDIKNHLCLSCLFYSLPLSHTRVLSFLITI